jgi:NHL repeat
MSPLASTQSLVRPLRAERLVVALVVFALSSVLGLVGGATVADAAPRGPVAAFDMQSPAGVAVNQTSGEVYVVDINNERIRHFGADGTSLPSIGGPGGAEGQFFFCAAATGVAVGTDGSLYVADTCNYRVQQFTADGTFVRMWGFGVQTGTDEVFEVCTVNCFPGLPGAGDGQFSSPRGVAVDPSNGDVLVADTGNQRVQRFGAAGAYQSQISRSGMAAPTRVAVDSTGAIYVAQDPEVGETVSMKFDASGTFVMALDQLSGAYDVAVDPATDHVFGVRDGSASGSSEVRELDASGALVETHLTPALPVRGLAVHSTTGQIYTSDTSHNRVLVLDEPVHTATVEPATAVESRSATLHGIVNPGGDVEVSYHFEVSADDGQTWTSFPEADEGSLTGVDDIPVSQPAIGLEPNREYLVRLVIRNELGFTRMSEQTTFTTTAEPPDTATLDATQLHPTGATLVGQVNPNNAQTTYRFEWGNTTSYGNSIPVPEASAGAGGSLITVVQQLAGLLPNTVYHYRIIATNTAGTTPGADRAFQTRIDPGVTPPTGRGYELVSPADKVGGVGVGHWYGGPDAVGYVGIAAQDGERFAVRGQSGSTITQDGAFAYVNDWVFAERTSGGWVHRPAVSRRAHAPQPTTDITLNAATPDLSVTGWGSAQFPKLFPEMAGWPDVMGSPLLIRRWSEPEWMLFGPTDPSQDVPPVDENGLPPPGYNDPISGGPKVFSPDGSAIVASAVGTRGLAGPGDPTSFGFDDRDDAAGSVYLDDTRGRFSDVFPGDDGIRQLVNVCTAGTVIPTATGSGPCPDALAGRDAHLTSPGGAALSVGGVTPPASVISGDGSRVFFMSPDPNIDGFSQPAQLFVWQRNVGQRASVEPVTTRWLSQSEVEGQGVSLTGPALFEGASSDGDKVFFRTSSPLTGDDPNSGCGASCTTGAASDASWDLYMYDLPNGPDGDPATPDGDPAGGTLTRVSAGPGGDSDCNVQAGTLRWVSADASRAYFTCSAPISAAGASRGTITRPGGTGASDDASNLYLYDATKPLEQRWTFVARLPRSGAFSECDTTLKGRGSTIAALPAGTGSAFSVHGFNTCVRGTSDGSLVTFFTDGRLTGDDPDAFTGDVYGYDAMRNELTRLSAPEAGTAVSYPCLPGREATSARCYGDGGIGPGAMALEMLGVAVRPDGDRLAFFESRSRLVAQDTDDAYDVYQWSKGKLSLISTGASDTDGAFYVGSDRSGLNVFFATRDQLTWQDKDRVLDVYTARVEGGIPQPPPTPECPVLGDGCQGRGTPRPAPQVNSEGPGGRNASPGPRKILSLKRLTASQRSKAARTGRLRLRVRATGVGRIRVVARAKVGGKVRVVGRGSKRVAKPGVVTVIVRLRAGARAVLASGRPLRVALRVSQSGARQRSMTLRLRRNAK